MSRREQRMDKDKDQDKLSGTPKGKGGIGRKEKPGRSGVYPASIGPENIPEDAEVKSQAEWGQGDRGAEGYEDSGRSELNFSLQEAEEYQREKAEKDKDKGKGKR